MILENLDTILWTVSFSSKIAYGCMKGFEDKYYTGRRPNGIHPRFRNIGGKADKEFP